MSTDIPTVFNRFHDIIAWDGSDDVSAVQALAEEVGVEAVINAQGGVPKESSLHDASYHDRVKTARQLIAWGADVDSRSQFEETPLHDAMSAEMVRVLVKEGGAKVSVLDKDGYSPLARNIESVEAMEALLDEGALVVYGRVTPLVYAIYWNEQEAVKVLLSRRGFVRVIEWKDEGYGETAREMAVSEGRHDIVAMLDEALVLAKIWERRLPVFRIGLAAVDARVTKEPTKKVFRGPKALKSGL